MKSITPELLLVFYLVLPSGTPLVSQLIALTLLSQIRAIHIVRQATETFDPEDEVGNAEKFWQALRCDPHNCAAHAYLGLSCLSPVFLNYQNGDRITERGFTLVGQASPNRTVQLQVAANVTLLGGVFNVGGETLVERNVRADEGGYFQVEVPAPSNLTARTRYIIHAHLDGDGELTAPAQMTLIQRGVQSRPI